jgi:hypothetical protein
VLLVRIKRKRKKPKNTTLSEQFQNLIKLVKRGNFDTLLQSSGDDRKTTDVAFIDRSSTAGRGKFHICFRV